MLCRRCKEDKEETEFFPSRLKKRDYRCRDCCKTYAVAHRKDNEAVRKAGRERMRRWRANNPELCQAQDQEQSIKHRERRNAYARKYAKDNPGKKNAQLKAAKAVKDGILIPQPCEVCGGWGKRIEKHHDDYSKPLEVRWFCSTHHHRHHKCL